MSQLRMSSERMCCQTRLRTCRAARRRDRASPASKIRCENPSGRLARTMPYSVADREQRAQAGHQRPAAHAACTARTRRRTARSKSSGVCLSKRRRHALGREPLDRAVSRAAAPSVVAPRRSRPAPPARAASSAASPGRVPDRAHAVVEQLGRAAAARRDDRPAAGHAFRYHHPEWLRRRARVNDDVERAQRGGHVVDVAGEADHVRESARRRQRPAVRPSTTGCRRSRRPRRR